MEDNIVDTLRTKNDITQKKVKKINSIERNMVKIFNAHPEAAEDLYWLIANYRISLYKEQITTNNQIEKLSKYDKEE